MSRSRGFRRLVTHAPTGGSGDGGLFATPLCLCACTCVLAPAPLRFARAIGRSLRDAAFCLARQDRLAGLRRLGFRDLPWSLLHPLCCIVSLAGPLPRHPFRWRAIAVPLSVDQPGGGALEPLSCSGAARSARQRICPARDAPDRGCEWQMGFAHAPGRQVEPRQAGCWRSCRQPAGKPRVNGSPGGATGTGDAVRPGPAQTVQESGWAAAGQVPRRAEPRSAYPRRAGAGRAGARPDQGGGHDGPESVRDRSGAGGVSAKRDNAR